MLVLASLLYASTAVAVAPPPNARIESSLLELLANMRTSSENACDPSAELFARSIVYVASLVESGVNDSSRKAESSLLLCGLNGADPNRS
uniref:Putative secreted protein n=1 Tax=Anopheles darlingi TaxID=43151 RepID=A0A2M4D3R2_ANODA